MKTKTLILLIVFTFCIGFTNTSAQIVKHQAAYVYNFSQLMKWPENQLGSEFVIAVFGSNQAITPELNQNTATRKVGARAIVVVEYASVDAIKSCQILFVPKKYTEQLKKITEKLGSSSTAIVTEVNDSNPSEATINLIMVDQKLVFHINKSDADSKKIVVSEKLLSLSK